MRPWPIGSWVSTPRAWAQLFLKLVISHPAVTCAIPATSKLQHLRDNMQAGLGRLPDAKRRERFGRTIADI